MSQFEDLAMEATTVGNQSRPTRLAASGLSPSSLVGPHPNLAESVY